MDEPPAIAWSRPLPGGAGPSTVTVSRDGAGWFVSMPCADAVDSPPATDRAVGVDAGLTSLVTLSTGEEVAIPRHERRERVRPAKARRTPTRKRPGSANRAEARSTCGALHEKLPRSTRSWTCACGTVHDRDVIAARGILAAGRAVIACGDGVRPQRESSRTGRSSVKQETRPARAGTSSLRG